MTSTARHTGHDSQASIPQEAIRRVRAHTAVDRGCNTGHRRGPGFRSSPSPTNCRCSTRRGPWGQDPIFPRRSWPACRACGSRLPRSREQGDDTARFQQDHVPHWRTTDRRGIDPIGGCSEQSREVVKVSRNRRTVGRHGAHAPGRGTARCWRRTSCPGEPGWALTNPPIAWQSPGRTRPCTRPRLRSGRRRHRAP
jgi:hypothetical protein